MRLLQAFAVAALLATTARADVVRQPGWTFEVGETPMSHVTDNGFRRMPDWKTKAKWVVPPRFAKGELPAHWDWRDKGVVQAIRDQASPVYCGSCWAHGTAAAFESAIAIKTGKLPSISPQQLVSCQPSYGTCGGGDFAFGFYQDVAADHENDFPYVAQDVSCTDAPGHEKAASWGYVGSSDREPTIDELKSAIYTYGPVAVTVASSSSWSSYKGGIYNACDSQDINHIVAIVGWDDTDQTWIVKNSHGVQFGEKGYMRSKWNGDDGQKCNGLGGSAAFVVPAG